MFRSNQVKSAEDRIHAEIREINQALDELRRNASRDTRERYDVLKSRAEQLWEGSRDHMLDGYDEIRRHSLAVGRQVSECARAHPLASIALGVGTCALIGWLLTRR